MLENTEKIRYSIERFTPDVVAETINIEIVSGSMIEGKFVSDGRALIKRSIRNIQSQDRMQVDTLIVDAAGQVLLTRVPVDNNQIDINGQIIDHETGQTVNCDGYSEGDQVFIKYYYSKPGRNWFDEQALFVKEDHAKYKDMNDSDYNSNRIWDVLLEMGLVSGVVV